MTPAGLGRAYGFDVIDYDRPGPGIAISSGAGGLMAVMDAALCCRWALSVEGMGDSHLDRLFRFAEACAHLGGHAAAFCFYGIDVPSPARTFLAPFGSRCVWLCGNAELGLAECRVSGFPELSAADRELALCSA
jgi:hypothetical protein